MTTSIDHACSVDGHRRGIVDGVRVPSAHDNMLKAYLYMPRRITDFGACSSVYIAP